MVQASSYQFGRYRLDVPGRRLLRDGEPVALTPKAFDTLLALIERRDRVVDKTELMQIVWPDSFVEEANLSQTIFVLRRLLGCDGEGRQFIDTVARRGYRFASSVTQGHTLQPTRLIVLPFRRLRSDPETDFLAFSIPDAITASLAGLNSLVVRSSFAASKYTDMPIDVNRLALEAAVDLVVAGTIIRAGDRLRVTAQLHEAASGTLVWSHSADAAMGELFALQDEITQRIVASLATPLSARERSVIRGDVPASATAYEYYLRANQLLRDAAQWAVARDLYRRAVEADPQYAPAWAQLGRVLRLIGKYVAGDSAVMAEAEDAVRRALAINPELAVAHSLYALLDIDLGRPEEAIRRLLERARHAGADPEIFKGLVHACRYCGLLEASLAAHAKALRLDPHAETSVIHTYWQLGEYDRVAAMRHVTASMTLMLLGRTAEALVMAQNLEGGPDSRRLVVAAERAYLEGRRADALQALEQVASGYYDAEGLYYVACEFAFFGADDRAADVLAGAVERGFCCFPAMMQHQWLNRLAGKAGYAAAVRMAEARHVAASAVFRDMAGNSVLGAEAGRT